MAHSVQSLVLMPTSSEHRALCPNLRRIVYSIHEGIKFTILWLLLSAHGEKCLASNSASTAECFVTPTSTPNSFWTGNQFLNYPTFQCTITQCITNGQYIFYLTNGQHIFYLTNGQHIFKLTNGQHIFYLTNGQYIFYLTNGQHIFKLTNGQYIFYLTNGQHIFYLTNGQHIFKLTNGQYIFYLTNGQYIFYLTNGQHILYLTNGQHIFKLTNGQHIFYLTNGQYIFYLTNGHCIFYLTNGHYILCLTNEHYIFYLTNGHYIFYLTNGHYIFYLTNGHYIFYLTNGHYIFYLTNGHYIFYLTNGHYIFYLTNGHYIFYLTNGHYIFYLTNGHYIFYLTNGHYIFYLTNGHYIFYLTNGQYITSTLYSTDNPQTTSALFTISVVQSWTLAVSTPTTHDQTYIAIVTAAFIAIGCAVILGISLALIIGVSLAFIAYARSSRPTGHRQRIKADDEFHCVNKNHYISEDIRTSDIETTFGAEQSNGGGESDTLSLEDLSTFQKLTEPSLGPIQVSDFQQYMSDLKSGRGIQLAVQFRTIEAYSLSLSTDKHHVCSERSSKDRYTNILPYLHSRVKLTQGPGLDDYINASYIDGYNQKDRYIAAQGPMKNTLEDFWRMVWECSVDMIVMLTKCCENGQSKCEQYWAGKVGGAFETGLFSIVTASFVHMLDYEIRTLVLTNNSDPNSKPRKLTHYYYTAWPDHGVPRNPSSMVGFVRQIQRAHARNEGVPLLVHCSAGVGRTGTFMVLDAMLKRIVWEGTVDVYGFLKHIRSQRCMLVQTVDQFSFIHDVLNDFLICGDTEILACDLKVKVKEMQTPINGQTMNAFQKQFELLGQLSIKQAEDDVSNKEDMLSSTLASSFSADRPTKSEEITAICFIDGFQQRSAYMVAQAPDECRRSSFWEAIGKHQARVLVVLGRVQHVYWPQENGQSITCDKLEVQHQSTCTQDGGILERCLRIVNESSVMDVVQLELTEWPAEGQPETSIMIQLLEAVTKTQLATLTRCTAVLSSDGAVGGSGDVR
ncbi:hypothetical protein EMCRGX_G022488 [Ephydatia muelleri]